MQQSAILLGKYQGCLFGLAIGDALGAPVEFITLDEIKRRYGKAGVTDFQPWNVFNAGSYTDDTQMALATAVGCVSAYQRWLDKGICNPTAVIYRYYKEWFYSQDIKFNRRAPGSTCMEALSGDEDTMGTLENKINNSKGNGGVMRMAPAGLVLATEIAFQKGAEFAAITHSHPSGYLSAGFLAQVIAYIKLKKSLNEAIELSIKKLKQYDGFEETLGCIEQAITLSKTMLLAEDAIAQIGSGLTGEQALGISLYCALKFRNNWVKGVLASVNHSGDSDTTGAITGAILGALLGIKLIPTQWILNVENSKVINKIATDMFDLFTGKIQELSRRDRFYYITGIYYNDIYKEN